jgi:hypothetical protein
MLLLVLHQTGVGWDEAALMIGGLTVLSSALLLFLRRSEPATDEARVKQPQPPTPGSGRGSRRHRH